MRPQPSARAGRYRCPIDEAVRVIDAIGAPFAVTVPVGSRARRSWADLARRGQSVPPMHVPPCRGQPNTRGALPSQTTLCSLGASLVRRLGVIPLRIINFWPAPA